MIKKDTFRVGDKVELAGVTGYVYYLTDESLSIRWDDTFYTTILFFDEPLFFSLNLVEPTTATTDAAVFMPPLNRSSTFWRTAKRESQKPE